MNQYIQSVLDFVRQHNSGQAEFIQAVEEVLTTLEPVVAVHPEYQAEGILERLVEPERIILFRVPWVD
ncbi:MAG: NADP-specific glutamate dehydrogenase, partial [Kiritimatiellae bacterium]|nr:NADP-specific glutamate dehydrogenase [Kiritimatiellia bacterium]